MTRPPPVATFQDEEEPLTGPRLDVKVLPDGDYSVGITPKMQPRVAVRFRATGSIHPAAAVRAVRDLHRVGTGENPDPSYVEALTIIEEALEVVEAMLGADMGQFLRRPNPQEMTTSNDHYSKLSYLYNILTKRRLPKFVEQHHLLRSTP